MNRFPLLTKTLVVTLLMALLFIPLQMVLDLISSRTQYRDMARESVAQSSAGEQTLVGPLLVTPFSETYTTSAAQAAADARADLQDAAGAADAARAVAEVQKNARSVAALVQVTDEMFQLSFPESVANEVKLETEVRHRGAFPVTVYHSTHDIKARIEPASPSELKAKRGGKLAIKPTLLVIGVGDTRGVTGTPHLKVAGQTVALERIDLPFMHTALSVPVSRLPKEAFNAKGELVVDLQLALSGTGSIGWVPLGDTNRVHLTSSWPHPNFKGGFLPVKRAVSAQGFEATWDVNAIATQARSHFGSERQQRQEAPALEGFSVSLMDPADIYLKSERAAKYGVMFIVLTFAAFFIFETVKRQRVHPMQYLMVGLALVVFFVLLLSLSERLGFGMAYAASAIACVGLLASYLRSVLRGWRPALGMTGLLAALYGLLYGILVSEDNALLLGSLLLFGAVALAMWMTRRVDWYRVGAATHHDAAPQHDAASPPAA